MNLVRKSQKRRNRTEHYWLSKTPKWRWIWCINRGIWKQTLALEIAASPGSWFSEYSKAFQINYNVTDPQFKFLRLLSSRATKQFIYECSSNDRTFDGVSGNYDKSVHLQKRCEIFCFHMTKKHPRFSAMSWFIYMHSEFHWLSQWSSKIFLCTFKVKIKKKSSKKSNDF